MDDQRRTISVVGTGRVSRPPDVVEISIGISLVRSTVAEATDDAARLASSVIDALRAGGIDSDDLQTADYSVFAEYDHRPQRRVLVGYRVGNTVRALVRDLAALPTVLSQAAGAGGDATTIGGISFSNSDPDELRVEARSLAWADALAVAQQLASLSGLTLGSARSISEVGGRGPVPPPSPARMATAEAAVPIESGTVEEAVSLAVEFEAT